jgi:peptide/nickel transport system permease protein
VVQGVVLLIATAFVMINFLTDLVYSLVDPRVRRAGV